ncbi:hypothetical protein I3842_07G110900 [Carya illinoinensis]|uniref:Uncharacterized protein n=1 Tax=Carya illinoinensis TaxID=32201 RepID=A0A922ELQ2_CARIL|nr:hypothetical protein I3842_07G110900 [Carya illinoinensis]
MPSYYGPMPHAWLPPFMPNPSSNPYPWTNQQHPWNSTCAAASSTAALSSSATLYSSAIPMMGIFQLPIHIHGAISNKHGTLRSHPCLVPQLMLALV